MYRESIDNLRDSDSVTLPSVAQEQPDGPAKQSTRKVVLGAVLGTVVEYYDFSIYGYMATLLSVQFFVAGDDTAALLGTFSAFAVAFFMRIPGGIFFGHIGDKYGRKTALTWSLFLMAASTLLIGLLPTYATLGIWATVFLVFCRCLQGFSAGGELGGANIFVSEHAPRRWRAVQTSIVMSGAYIGSLVASVAALLVSQSFDEQQVLDWAWRLPFLFSAFIGLIGLYIRNTLHDSPEFKALKKETATKKLPIKTLLQRSWKKLLVLVMLYGISAGGYYIASVYMATHLQQYVGHDFTVAFASTCTALVVGVCILPIAGYFADRFGRRPVLMTGALSGFLLVVPMFHLMDTGSIAGAFFAQSVCFACVSIFNGALFTTFSEQLETSVRYSGVALVTNVANSLMGGTAPMIATLLVSTSGNPTSPAWYYAATALLSLIAVFLIKETRGIELR